VFCLCHVKCAYWGLLSYGVEWGERFHTVCPLFVCSCALGGAASIYSTVQPANKQAKLSMHRGALPERVASELRTLSPSERKVALAQLNALVRDFGGQAEQLLHAEGRGGGSLPSLLGGSTRRGACAVLTIVLFVFLFLLQASNLGGTSMEGISSHVLPEHGPLGPSALQSATGAMCDCPVVTAPPKVAPRCPPPPLLQLARTAPRNLPYQAPARPRADRGPWSGESELRRADGTYPNHGAFRHPQDALRWLRPQRNTSDFPLLLCIGQGKTATKSLNKALVMLGFRSAHFYGAGVYGLLYDNAAEATNHHFLFNVDEEKHVDAVLDTPVVDFYNEILLAYPNARVILTVRDPRSWLRSQQKFYCCFARGCRNWLAPWRRGSNLIYGTECPSKEQAMKRYVQHNRNVYDNVPHDRLLVMDIPRGDGWETLLPFLNSFLPHKISMPPQNLTFPSRH
jgi:hypothetical protein